MSGRLLICTDLDRTLIPNGPQPESPGAREVFSQLVGRPEVTLAFVTGRHRALVERAISHYCLPVPDFVIGDVGTTLYHVGQQHDWTRQPAWEDEIGADWAGHAHADLKAMLSGIRHLRLQEHSKQNRFKLSYYLPLHADRNALETDVRQRLQAHAIQANLIWSVDEPAGIGLLDILPGRASKYHAIEALMRLQGFTLDDTVFSGDSGNDLEVLASPIPAVLVANSQPEVREQALALSRHGGHEQRLYIARGGFLGMNGNYSAGVLEGVVHYHPQCQDWLDIDTGRQRT